MQRFRLPEFVTPANLEGVLQWVASQRRTFHESAADMPFEDWRIGSDKVSLYQDICNLLRLAGGGEHLEFIAQRCFKKDRGLRSAITNRLRNICAGIAGARPSIPWLLTHPSEIIEREHEVAWFVFGYLSSVRSDADFHDYLEEGDIPAIEAASDLRKALGPYWVDWNAYHRPGTVVCEAVGVEGVVDQHDPVEVNDASAWRARLVGTVADLRDDGSLSRELSASLRALADELDAILDGRAERQARTIRAQITADLERVRTRLAEGSGFPDVSALLAAIAAAQDGAVVRIVVDRMLGMIDRVAQARANLLATRDREQDEEERHGYASKDSITAAFNAKISHADVQQEAIAEIKDTIRHLIDATPGRLEVEPDSASTVVHLRDRVRSSEQSVPSTAPITVDEPSTCPPVRTAPRLEPTFDRRAPDPDGRARTVEANRSVLPPASGEVPEAVDAAPILALSREDAALPRVTLPADDGPTTADGNVDALGAMPSLGTGLEPQGAVRARALVWEALAAGRAGLAFHLARAAQALGAASFDGYEAALQALALGPAFVVDPNGPAASSFGANEINLLDAANYAGADPDLWLLVFAGSLQPALFSQQTGAGEILRTLDLGTFGPALRELVGFVVEELPRRGGALDPFDLAAATDERAAREEVVRRRDGLLAFARTAPDRRSVFNRVDRILIEILRAGPVAEAFEGLARGDLVAAQVAESAAAWLAQDAEGRATILDMEARRARREAPLEGLARKQLLATLQSLAVDLSAWARAVRASIFPRDARREETRTLFQVALTGALHGLDEAAFAAVAEPIRKTLHRILEELHALTEGARPSDPRAGASLTPSQLLSDDLLLIDPAASMPAAGTLSEGQAARFVAAAEPIIGETPDFCAAFDRLLQASRYEEAAAAARRIREDETARSDRADNLAASRSERRQELRRRVRTLRRRTDDLLGADAEGRVDPDLLPALDRLGQTLEFEPEFIDFPQVRAEIAARETAIDDFTQMLIEPFRASIDGLERDGHDVGTLRTMVAAGDLTILRESIDAVRAGADLRGGDRPGALPRAFAETYLTAGFERLGAGARNMVDLVQAAERRVRTDAVDFSSLPPEDVTGAQELLRAWAGLRAGPGDRIVALRVLFEALRFSNVKLVAAPTNGAARRFTLTCDRIADRSICPIPEFGSGAGGRYEILLIASDAVRRGDEIVQHLKTLQFPATATLVVVTGQSLPTARRREFLLAARGGAPGSCGLIDEAVVFFLASRPARGLADLFAIALPSGRVQPYSDATGATAREMFFGRRRELDQLWDRDGSCLVYGGRQLGKTALLDQIRVRHDDGASQRVLGGSLQGRYDLWDWLNDLLRDGKIIPKSGVRAHRPEQRIRAWLDEDSARRLVILVDEADTYLEAELRDDYRTLAQVRDLMLATTRRCKFIFAGLHNVQRLARERNSPLLHFGLPLSIGPLYGPDLGEAREMVELPAAAAGFVFADRHLPSRILSEVGYYPSLLQTFAKALLSRLNAAATIHLEPRSLLITVTEAQLDATLDDVQFREEIHRKFESTLGLDERYRLITYAMLLQSLSARENGGLPVPLTEAQARELALGWWPMGFTEASSLDAFEGLLQEMVGLGVLIELNGRYAIRSARIAAMLGSKRQIEDKLAEFLQRSGPEALDAGNLRRFVRDGRVPSPLTKRQITALLAADRSAVRIMIGTPALGLDEVAETLIQAGAAAIIDVTSQAYTTVPEALAHLTDIQATEVRRPILLVLSGPWLGRRLVEALRDHEVFRRKTRGRETVQVALVALDIAWQDVGAIDAAHRLWGVETTVLLPLGPDGLRQWCRKMEVADAGAIPMRLRKSLGGFPTFLDGIAGATTGIQAAADKIAADPTTLERLGLGAPEPRRAAAILDGAPQSEADALGRELITVGTVALPDR